MSVSTLEGRVVALTRSEEQNSPVRERLLELGAQVIAVPTLRFTVAEDLRQWTAALEHRDKVTHVVFTSQNSVRFFLKLSDWSGITKAFWLDRRVAAIGERTAANLADSALPAHLQAEHSTGIGFATELVERENVGPGSVVLLPQSALASTDVENFLVAAGATVLAVPVYETLPEDSQRAAPLLDALDRGTTVDAIIFASPSALHAFLELTAQRGRRMLEGNACRIVSIGTTTSRALRDAGLTVAAEAAKPDTEGLVKAVVGVVGGE